MGIESKCKPIQILLTDVDGVLTDGAITYDSENRELKSFNVKDGYICSFLRSSGIKLGIITGRKSEIVAKRAKELGFDYLYQGVKDKKAILNEIMSDSQATLDQIAYIGDDLNDLEILESVGLSASPNDAFDYVKCKVDYVCERSGGRGAFRELADLILTNKDEDT